MAQKLRFLISHDPESIPFYPANFFHCCCHFGSIHAVSEAAFITFISHSSFHLAGNYCTFLHLAGDVAPHPADTVHFIFQILQTFVIIHFLLLCVHSINVIYEADFVQKISFIVRFCVGRWQKSHGWIHEEEIARRGLRCCWQLLEMGLSERV